MVSFVGFPQDDHSFSAAEVGMALAGLIVRDGGVPRVGMLGGVTVSAVPSAWKVQVGAFVYVHQVAGAVQLSGISAPEQVDIVSAAGIPAGQGRIDLVVWDPVAAELAVLTGTAAASPVPPAAGGMAAVARVRVNAGDGMVVAGQVSVAAAVTELVGAKAPVAGLVPATHVGGSGTVITDVTFPAGSFTSAPVVVVSVVAGASEGLTVAVADVTATGFRLRRACGSMRPGGYAFGASWVAIPT